MAARDLAPNGTQPHESDEEEPRHKPSCEALDSAKEAEETIPQQNLQRQTLPADQPPPSSAGCVSQSDPQSVQSTNDSDSVLRVQCPSCHAQNPPPNTMGALERIQDGRGALQSTSIRPAVDTVGQHNFDEIQQPPKDSIVIRDSSLNLDEMLDKNPHSALRLVLEAVLTEGTERKHETQVLKGQLGRHERQHAELKDQLSRHEKQSKRDKEELQEQINDLKRVIDEKDQEIEVLKKQVSDLESQGAGKDELCRKDVELRRKEDELRTVKERLKQTEQEKMELEQELQNRSAVAERRLEAAEVQKQDAERRENTLLVAHTELVDLFGQVLQRQTQPAGPAPPPYEFQPRDVSFVLGEAVGIENSGDRFAQDPATEAGGSISQLGKEYYEDLLKGGRKMLLKEGVIQLNNEPQFPEGKMKFELQEQQVEIPQELQEGIQPQMNVLQCQETEKEDLQSELKEGGKTIEATADRVTAGTAERGQSDLEDPERQLTKEEVGVLMEQYDHWLSTPNVVSIVYCKDKTTGRKVLRVGVIKKQEQVIPPDIAIPQYVEFETPKERVKVLVKQVEGGHIVPLGAPYPGGSHLKTEGVEEYGCAAATVAIGGNLRLLSAAHVLTNFDRQNIGKTIYLRSCNETDIDEWEEAGVVKGQIDVQCYSTDRELCPTKATQDLAWAEVNDGVTKPQYIERIGRVDIIRPPREDEEVKMFGGVSDSEFPLTDPEEKPTVESTQAKVKLRVRHPAGKTKYAYFKDVCFLSCTAYLTPGDSGSAIVGVEDNAIIGVLFAEEQKHLGNYFFCEIPPDLDTD